MVERVERVASKTHNEALRAIVKNKVLLNDNQYKISDDCGNDFIVDLEEGLSYKIIYGIHDCKKVVEDIEECNTGDKSKKDNGYVYMPLQICIDGKIKEWQCAIQTVVCMLAYENDFDRLIDSDSKLIVGNHKNNCPWENYKDNVEWVPQCLNRLHGIVVHSIWDNKDWLEQLRGHKYCEIKHNLSEKDYICLCNGLSCDYLEEYERHINARRQKCISLTKYWEINKKDGKNRINQWHLVEFLNWLENIKGVKLYRV